MTICFFLQIIGSVAAYITVVADFGNQDISFCDKVNLLRQGVSNNFNHSFLNESLPFYHEKVLVKKLTS